jgi:hypothetical protein
MLAPDLGPVLYVEQLLPPRRADGPASLGSCHRERQSGRDGSALGWRRPGDHRGVSAPARRGCTTDRWPS